MHLKALAIINFILFRTSLSLRFKTHSPLIMAFSTSRAAAAASAAGGSALTAAGALSRITELTFDNRNVNTLPTESSMNMSSRQVPNSIFSLVNPTPLRNPIAMSYSTPVFTDLLGLQIPITEEEVQSYAEFFSGNKVIPGSRPAAHCYCGHQFGNFAGQLGDGATMYLGEVINQNTGKRWELQLKGAGKTPYSRTADGRKVLRSSVREYLCSEAMFHLGVPTTRAASCVTSDSTVQRDPMYDGGVIDERCTVVSRVASNFFRFGSFEIFKTIDPEDGHSGRAGPSAGNTTLKKELLEHILTYYPTICTDGDHVPDPVKYERFFREIVRRTAYLTAKWQTVGFVHGVLNTDNMSIMGLTIDYGPYGFMEHFDPQYVPNGSDNSARYSYQEQPQICKWNLGKLAEMLNPLLPLTVSERILTEYDDFYNCFYDTLMGGKLGLVTHRIHVTNDTPGDEPVPTGNGVRLTEHDAALVQEYFAVLAATHCDFTDSFVALTDFVEKLKTHIDDVETVDAAVLKDLTTELTFNLLSRTASPAQVVQSLRRNMRILRLGMHPAQIEQIHRLLETAPADQLSRMFNGAPIDAIRAEISGEKRALDALARSSAGIKRYEAIDTATKRRGDRDMLDEWVRKYADRMVSLLHSDRSVRNQAATDGTDVDRVVLMHSLNPTFILRSWLAQDAISLAQGKKADFSGVSTLLKMLQDPFNPLYSTFLSEQETTCSAAMESGGSGSGSVNGGRAGLTALEKKYTGLSPDWADSIICTCSS